MQFAFRTILGRFSILAIATAIIAGGVWSWRTAPWYLVPDQYFITVNPQQSALQRDSKPLDLQDDFQRRLLVTGSMPMSFGVDSDIDSRLMRRGLEIGSQLAKSDASFYSKDCGSPDERGKPRVNWKGTRLCNTGNLDGDVWQAAVQVFHQKVDDEISDYQASLTRNAVDKVGKSVLVALALTGILAAGLWVAKGKLA